MGRIVVGVDGSPASRRALHWAAAEAEHTGSDLQVVMTWRNPDPAMWVPHDRPGTDPAALTRTALARITAQTLGDTRRVAVEEMTLEGPPAQTLLDVAAGADLLVVGNRGLGEFTGMLLGSVSLHCVSHAKCPVVVVR